MSRQEGKLSGWKCKNGGVDPKCGTAKENGVVALCSPRCWRSALRSVHFAPRHGWRCNCGATGTAKSERYATLDAKYHSRLPSGPDCETFAVTTEVLLRGEGRAE